MIQREKGSALRRLHSGGRILVLPNAWDAASARVFEAAGFPAIATTSAGVAFAAGYQDGQRISRGEMVAVVSRIANRVQVPVTADMEAGYGPDPEDVAATVREVIAAGAVGMNLEDAEGPGELFDRARAVERVRAARETADMSDIPFVLNARTDVFLERIGEHPGRLAHAVERLRAYRAAGADCLFAPGVMDEETIGTLVREVGGPLNVLAVPTSLPISELERLGVARVSVGSGPMRAALGMAQRIAAELLATGTYQAMTGAPSHADVNRLFESGP